MLDGPGLALLTAASVALLAAWSLLTRLRREDMLRHDGRARLLAHLEEHPGCVLHHAAQTVGIDYKTAQHHVRLLRVFGLVDVEERNRARHLFPTGHFTRREKNAIVALRTGSARPLLIGVLEAPGIGLSGLARSTGMSKAGVARQLSHLSAAGLVSLEKGARDHRLYPTELAMQIVPVVCRPAEGARPVRVTARAVEG